MPLAEILPQIREIEEGRKIVGIEGESRIELAFRRGILSQAVGVNDATIEVNLFGLCHALLERPLIGGEGGIEAPRLALQDREVVPAVRQIGPTREQTLVSAFGL